MAGELDALDNLSVLPDFGKAGRFGLTKFCQWHEGKAKEQDNQHNIRFFQQFHHSYIITHLVY